MHIVLIGFVIIAIVLVAVLVYLLSINKNIKKSTVKKSATPLMYVDISNMQFPKNIESMNSDALFKAIKVIFDSYKALGYANKSVSSMDKIEWHSWQLSIILNFIKKDNNFFVSDDNYDLFHEVILELDKVQINHELQRIYKKYSENVNIYKNRDELSNDVIWTARDVSILLYTIINK